MKVVTAVVLMYAAYCAALFSFQRQVLFPSNLVPAASRPEISGITVESIWTGSGHGNIEHWLLPPAPGTSDGSAALIIFCHGNAEIKEYGLMEMLPFTRLGMAVLLVEYPGYGGSPGNPTQASITQTLTAAYDAVTQRPDIDAGRVVLFGRSLGGAAACQLADRRDTAAMILVSTFTSVTAFTRRYLIPDFLVRDPFDSLSVVKTYLHPILILHGRTDDIVPIDHGITLSRAAPQAEIVVYDSGHNDLPPDRRVWFADITRFLRKHNLIDSEDITHRAVTEKTSE
jgi:uncharacterized protein